MKVKSESEVAQSCPTPSDPMNSSLPGSSIHGIFQARVLEWGAIIGTAQMLMQMINGQGLGFPCSSENKEPVHNAEHRFNSWDQEDPLRREWQHTPVSLPGESCGQRRLLGYSP